MRVVSDSSSNVFEVEGLDYTSVPLKVMFGGREYVDEPGTDFEQMIHALHKQDGPSTTACPNVQEWLNAFEGADEVFGVTISSGLSGSYEAADMAARQYMEANPQAKAYIVDSLATGPFMELIIEELRRLSQAGETFERIREAILEYRSRTRILYSLESLNNLANNGRVNAAVAKIAGALNINIIGHASEQGTVEIIHRCRGQKKALHTLVQDMLDQGFAGGRLRISHTLNLSAAQKLRDLVLEKFPQADIVIRPNTGLCTYYADLGGLILGYEVE